MLTTRRFTSGDLEIRELEMTERGDFVPDHDHYFPHTSIVFSGVFRIRVKRRGEVLEHIVAAGNHLLIEAEDMHYLECVEPGKVWCTFCHRPTESGPPIGVATGWESIADERFQRRG